MSIPKLPPVVVNNILKFTMSKMGSAIRWLVGIFITWLVAKKHILPQQDAAGLEQQLGDGLMALVPIAYACVQFWLASHRVENNKKVQEAVNDVLPPDEKKLKVDGVIGYRTINAVIDATGADVASAPVVPPTTGFR